MVPRSIAAIVRASTPWLVMMLVACQGLGGEPGVDAPDPRARVSRDDYAVFAQRCSKCHSLARPLDSGITDDDAWAMYVARMRRQPGSGITEEDERAVLRVLHAYAAEARRVR